MLRGALSCHSRPPGRKPEGGRHGHALEGFGGSACARADRWKGQEVRERASGRALVGRGQKGGVQEGCPEVVSHSCKEPVPPAFGKGLGLFVITSCGSGPQGGEGTAREHWSQQRGSAEPGELTRSAEPALPAASPRSGQEGATRGRGGGGLPTVNKRRKGVSVWNKARSPSPPPSLEASRGGRERRCPPCVTQDAGPASTDASRGLGRSGCGLGSGHTDSRTTPSPRPARRRALTMPGGITGFLLKKPRHCYPRHFLPLGNTERVGILPRATQLGRGGAVI